MPSSIADRSVWYSYAILRVVPRVERGECLNAGVILFARTRRFLQAAVALDEKRLLAFAPDLDLSEVGQQLQAIQAICAGAVDGGPLASLPQSERFHLMTAPRSTIIQPSPVHTGCTSDPAATLEHLLQSLVTAPA
jgi:hypothetical protein